MTNAERQRKWYKKNKKNRLVKTFFQRGINRTKAYFKLQRIVKHNGGKLLFKPADIIQDEILNKSFNDYYNTWEHFSFFPIFTPLFRTVNKLYEEHDIADIEVIAFQDVKCESLNKMEKPTNLIYLDKSPEPLDFNYEEVDFIVDNGLIVAHDVFEEDEAAIDHYLNLALEDGSCPYPALQCPHSLRLWDNYAAAIKKYNAETEYE